MEKLRESLPAASSFAPIAESLLVHAYPMTPHPTCRPPHRSGSSSQVWVSLESPGKNLLSPCSQDYTGSNPEFFMSISRRQILIGLASLSFLTVLVLVFIVGLPWRWALQQRIADLKARGEPTTMAELKPAAMPQSYFWDQNEPKNRSRGMEPG
jgi:hypothetical protein